MHDQTISTAGDAGRAAAWVGDRFAIAALAATDGSMRSTQTEAGPDRIAHLALTAAALGARRRAAA